MDLDKDIALAKDELIGLRRDLHAHPELGHQEYRTAGLVADLLRRSGLEVVTGVSKTGLVGLLRGSKPGKTVLVRADMDALPIAEQNEVGYRSQVEGVMHACGHDAHTAVAVTVAGLLAKYREDMPGNVKFVFQPAEETANGAKDMIEAGVMGAPAVDAVFAFHLWNNMPVGKIGLRVGPAFAGADEIEIVVTGEGGHGAEPHRAVDAIVVASQVINSLQTLVSRETPPTEAVVVTIGTISGGTAFNVIADSVRMTGTVRTFDMALRDRILERIRGMVKGVTSAMRADYQFECRFACPPVINDVGMTELVRRTAASVVGEQNVVAMEPVMGSDDMAYFLQAVPGCYFVVGSANDAKGLNKPHHHPRFDFDEGALPLATITLAKVVVSYLTSLPIT
ncbi:MAG: amidohydrolase [Chloroflexi bacterium]|nr:amidohydrolase [Chloroflexota bacterium]